MTITRRFAFGMLACLATLGVVYVKLSFPTTAAAVAGRRAPAVDAGAPDEVFRIDPAFLTAGHIVAMTDDSTDIFVLQNRSWIRADSLRVHGPFGTATRGSPGAITSASDIAVNDTAVFVLDRPLRSIHVYRKNGVWVGTLSLPATRVGMTFEHIATASSGLFVTAFRNASPQPARVIFRSSDGLHFDSLWSTPSSLFEVVAPVPFGNTLFVLRSSPYSLTELSTDGMVVGQVLRPHPALVPMPDSMRRSLAGYLNLFHEKTGRRVEIPAHLPPVLAAARTPDGRFVTVEASAMDSVWIEILDNSGIPLHTFGEEAVSLPVAVTRFGLLTVREEANVTFVERRRFPPMGK